MNSRNTISEELRAICPLLADHQPVMPYPVPAGYFEELAGTMLALVGKEPVSSVIGPAAPVPYSVPEGFFDQFPAQMLSRVTGEAGIRLPVSKTMPYATPENYFDSLPDFMLRRVQALDADSAHEELESLSPLLSRIGKKQPFSTPEGYFDALPADVTDGAKAIDLVNEELENLSPLMIELKKEQAYTVPEGYFDSLPERMLGKVSDSGGGRLVTMRRTDMGRRIMRYAAAALVAGLMLTAGWKYVINRPVSVTPDNGVSLAVPDNIPDDALEAYVENQTSSYAETAVADAAPMNENDLRELLADVSDAELQKYVEQTGGTLNYSTN